MRLTLCILFSLPFALGISQTVTITGQVIEVKSNRPLQDVSVYLYDKDGTTADESGHFTLICKQLTSKDTIKVRYVGFFDLNYINLPTIQNNIEFETIPLFSYFRGASMVEFFCGRFDFKCKHNRRRHYKEENRKDEAYFLKRDSIISNYKYDYNGNSYKIRTKDYCIDLSTPL